ncbi:MAG: PAS domain S-box protein [Deltaproteobacteria bacterium]|nr:PAS domain S-box protein [Deltaproteobacteria bacterium]
MKDENKSRQQLISELQNAREQLAILQGASVQYALSKERKETLRIIENGPLVTFVWRNTSGWPVEFVTANVEKMFGYTPVEFLTGKLKYDQIIYADDLKRVLHEVTQYSGDKSCSEFTHAPYRIHTKQGEVKWVNDTTYIQRSETGEVTHFHGVLLDITEQKKYEQMLVENEERVSSTFNAITDAVLLHPLCDDGFAPFIEVNDTACKRYGYRRDEFLSLTAVDITDATQIKQSNPYENRKRLKKKKNLIFETIHVTKSGETFPVEINASVITLGGKKIILSVARDITDRKKVEESLRITQFSLDKAAIGAYCLNPAGNIYNVNDEAARMLGYTKEELESLCLFDIDPTVTHENYDAIWQVLADNGANFFESLHRKKDGTLLPVEIYANLLEYDGKIFSIAFSKDISKRKEAEKELNDNILRLQTIYNTLPIVVWATDAKGIFVLSEGNVLKKFGLKPGEIVGTSAFEVYKDYPDFIESLTQSLNGKPSEFESEINGIYLHQVLTPIYDENGNVGGVNALAIDVTEKRKADEELEHLRNYLSNIIDSMPSVLVGIDAGGCITQWNKTAEEKTGISAVATYGKPLATILPQLAPEIEKILSSIKSKRIIQEQKRSTTIDKQAIFEAMTVYPLIGYRHGMKGAVIQIDDVSDKIRMQEMLVQSEKMLSVGGLAAGMAHEINNPLAGILQTASTLSIRLSDNSNISANQKAAEKVGIRMSDIQEYMKLRDVPRMLQLITDSGKRVSDIIRNMLNFSRKSETIVSSHDLRVLMDQSLELAKTDYDLQKSWDFKGIKIVKDYTSDVALVPCEEVKIQQVLLNLLRNGSQAMQEAAINNPEFRIKIYNDSDRRMSCVEIEDNGPGMNEDTRKRVFEPFFSTKAPGVGTGLGLSVSYFIVVENHKGEIEVESNPGLGTKFILRLPYQTLIE